MAEITISIDSRPIRFKATGGTGYRYKAQFGREFIADMMKIQEFCASERVVTKKVDGRRVQQKTYDFTKFSLETIYNILWVLAKTADDAIPDPQSWLDSFETFPVMDIFQAVAPILQRNLTVDPKNG